MLIVLKRPNNCPICRSVPLPMQSLESTSFARLPPLQIGIPKAIHTISSSDPCFGVKREWNGSVPETWDVQIEDLEPVPALFPLEKTHREISEEPSIISSRISDALQALSIQTEFCNKKVKAKCQTNDFVTFRIRLYAGSVTGTPVVVEIQRRSGSPKSFMQTCRILLDAASYGKIPGADSAVRKVCEMECPLSTMLAPGKHMKCLGQVSTEPDASHVTKEIEALVALFDRNANTDQGVLALESLLCLTDALKSSPNIAIQASEAVFSNYQLRHHLLEQASDRHPFQADGMQYVGGRKRQLAFAVFANALESKASDLTGEYDWFSSRLVPAIVEALHHASEFTCVAYQASRCASQIASQSTILRHELKTHRHILERALQYGQTSHELIRDEMNLCLELLNTN